MCDPRNPDIYCPDGIIIEGEPIDQDKDRTPDGDNTVIVDPLDGGDGSYDDPFAGLTDEEVRALLNGGGRLLPDGDSSDDEGSSDEDSDSDDE